jgi:hypothetical protein
LDEVCKVKVRDQHLSRRRKAGHITPAELILLPHGATLGQLKGAVTDAFKMLYRWVSAVNGGGVCGMLLDGGREHAWL